MATAWDVVVAGRHGAAAEPIPVRTTEELLDARRGMVDNLLKRSNLPSWEEHLAALQSVGIPIGNMFTYKPKGRQRRPKERVAELAGKLPEVGYVGLFKHSRTS